MDVYEMVCATKLGDPQAPLISKSMEDSTANTNNPSTNLGVVGVPELGGDEQVRPRDDPFVDRLCCVLCMWCVCELRVLFVRHVMCAAYVGITSGD